MFDEAKLVDAEFKRQKESFIRKTQEIKDQLESKIFESVGAIVSSNQNLQTVCEANVQNCELQLSQLKE
jgi:hypothetical protein